MLKHFDESRQDLEPYGLTCELWESYLMRKPDRHNEIEINFLLEGSLTYLIHNKKIRAEKGKIIIFWGLMPHQIVGFDKISPYYVVTVPLNLISHWKLSHNFLDNLLRGEVYLIDDDSIDKLDYFLKLWTKDLQRGVPELSDVCMLEIQAFLKRMSFQNHFQPSKTTESLDLSVVEKMAVYIAANYTKGIKIKDVADNVDLHPDYANQLFKKMFGATISNYLINQRIMYAKRKLSVTNESITAIGYDAGFNTISRFNAAFLKINGCTPREFRKRYQQ